jgi:hypothetical protein
MTCIVIIYLDNFVPFRGEFIYNYTFSTADVQYQIKAGTVVHEGSDDFPFSKVSRGIRPIRIQIAMIFAVRWVEPGTRYCVHPSSAYTREPSCSASIRRPERALVEKSLSIEMRGNGEG